MDAVAEALVAGARLATQSDTDKAVSTAYRSAKQTIAHYSSALSVLEAYPFNKVFQSALSEQLDFGWASEDLIVLEAALKLVRALQEYSAPKLSVEEMDSLQVTASELLTLIKRVRSLEGRASKEG